MLLIVAALREELKVAEALCDRVDHRPAASGRCRMGWRGARSLGLIRCGVGPVRSRDLLSRTLTSLAPERILCIGYAGALDPALRVGDLVAVSRAVLLNTGRKLPFELLEAGAAWELSGVDELLSAGAAAGVTIKSGPALTSAHIIGEPAQKSSLFRKFGALAVDMETAALARSAIDAGIPFSCVRTISDQADDEFLAPFSYDPSSGPLARVARVLRSGRWRHRLGEWRTRARAARSSLKRLLEAYLDTLP